MDKLKMHTPDLVDAHIKKIAEIFPNAITETMEGGTLRKVIDFDVLRQELSGEIVEGNQERYQFTWPDKKKSIILANEPIAKTLRLDREKSVGRDGTPESIDSDNIYIEGDNLDALKLLQETYLGKVKLIYIDPPYNTGNDFIYNDSFKQDTDAYVDNSGQTDEGGNQLVQNTESNGRFHTDWLNMMYPRLRIAKDFLAEDGSIFITIDDHEYSSLKMICDEVFGLHNYQATIVWENFYGRSNAAAISPAHNYILIYSKAGENWKNIRNLLPRSESSESKYKNPDNDPKGSWRLGPIFASGERHQGLMYTITTPSGKKVSPPKGSHWRMLESEFWKKVEEGTIVFGENGDNIPATKLYLNEVQSGMVPRSIWMHDEVGHTQEGKREIQALFPGDTPFDTPKPTRLLKQIIAISTNPGDIVMDFFSGSASTADAAIQISQERKQTNPFIMIQLPEIVINKNFNNEFETICDIGEERIRRAGQKIKEESLLTTQDLDIGFRCFRVDSSNMKDVYYKPSDYDQNLIDRLSDNIKAERTPEDLLIQVMLDLGVLLSSKIEETEIAGKKVFSVADGYLIACFDRDITDDIVTEIAQRHPFYAVFRDSSMADDSVAANFEQIFETYSPSTVRKVL